MRLPFFYCGIDVCGGACIDDVLMCDDLNCETSLIFITWKIVLMHLVWPGLAWPGAAVTDMLCHVYLANGGGFATIANREIQRWSQRAINKIYG